MSDSCFLIMMRRRLQVSFEVLSPYLGDHLISLRAAAKSSHSSLHGSSAQDRRDHQCFQHHLLCTMLKKCREIVLELLNALLSDLELQRPVAFVLVCLPHPLRAAIVVLLRLLSSLLQLPSSLSMLPLHSLLRSSSWPLPIRNIVTAVVDHRHLGPTRCLMALLERSM
ncbi:uncharacterized protein LOC116199197 [Punica granatum]|uniref:Uncharacterized protein LOC116199197 n=1 Tax=Punica granatum TaxID=22663 RepID=A0A6P8CP27_PUNGR|nr:uncharacterized protein LOC116199197 [Punica granatum]